MASQHSLPGLGGGKGAPPELGIHNQAHFPSSPAFSCPSSYMQGLLSPCCRPILLICNPTTCLNHPLFPKWMMPLPSESPQHSTGISCGRPSPYSFKSHLSMPQTLAEDRPPDRFMAESASGLGRRLDDKCQTGTEGCFPFPVQGINGSGLICKSWFSSWLPSKFSPVLSY